MTDLAEAPGAIHVEILLATYNGAKYLGEFLGSLDNQDYADWSLTVRDDASRDDTVRLLEEWGERNPGRLKVIDRNTPNLGHVRSFSRLLEMSTADYVMFADQDDTWLAEKVRLTLEAMLFQEKKSEPGRPIVVHTDAFLADAQLRPLGGGTSWSSQGFWPVKRSGFKRIMVENIVMGCTAMLNRPLVDLVGDIPSEAIYHDWWIALVASAFGDIVSIRKPLMFWRRHGSNESEMSDLRQVFWLCLRHPAEGRRRLTRIFNESGPRVSAFLRRYRQKLRPDQISAAEAFVRLPDRGFLERRVDIIAHGLYFVVPLRNAGLLIFI